MEEKVKKERVPATAKSKPAEAIAKETPIAPAKEANEKVTAAAPAKPKAAASRAKKAAPDAESSMLHAVQAKSKPAGTDQKRTEPSREQIAQLAHRFWKERGGHHGAHEQDWFRAERELRGMAS